MGFRIWGFEGCPGTTSTLMYTKQGLLNSPKENFLSWYRYLERPSTYGTTYIETTYCKEKPTYKNEKEAPRAGCNITCAYSFISAKDSFARLRGMDVYQRYWAPQCALSQSQNGVGTTLTSVLRFAVLKSYLRCSVAINSCIRATLA